MNNNAVFTSFKNKPAHKNKLWAGLKTAHRHEMDTRTSDNSISQFLTL